MLVNLFVSIKLRYSEGIHCSWLIQFRLPIMNLSEHKVSAYVADIFPFNQTLAKCKLTKAFLERKFDFKQRSNWYKSNGSVWLGKTVNQTWQQNVAVENNEPRDETETKRSPPKPNQPHLRRSHQLPPISAMAEEGSGAGAEMDALIRRLRLHQAVPSPYDPAPEATPAADGGGGELFRPRRAAVLVCLFRGAAGELRVILTKRSSTLSTHSGEPLARFLACPSSVLCLV